MISPDTIAVESIITGPLTSISPLTAPAITADVPLISPTITVSCPILTAPLATISPSILASFANTSPALDVPLIVPLTVNLPRQLISPIIVPNTSIEPKASNFGAPYYNGKEAGVNFALLF